MTQPLVVGDGEANGALFQLSAVERTRKHVDVYEEVQRQLRGEDVLDRLLHADKQILLAQLEQIDEVV